MFCYGPRNAAAWERTRVLLCQKSAILAVPSIIWLSLSIIIIPPIETSATIPGLPDSDFGRPNSPAVG